MSDIWHGLGLTYFQVPDSFIQLMPKLNPNSKDLYLLLMYKAQKASSTNIELTAQEIADFGVSARRMKDAIAALVSVGLVKFSRKRSSNDSKLVFELLDPETRMALPSLKDRKLDAATLSREQRTDYALDRLRDFEPIQDENGVNARCPFHDGHNHASTAGGRLSFNTRTGQWRCYYEQCDHNAGGHMVEFEMAMSQREGRQIKPAAAWERIVSRIRSSEREAAMRAQALAEAQDEMATA